jgi:hypothetical protein
MGWNANLYGHRHSQRVHGHHRVVLDHHHACLDRPSYPDHDRLDYGIDRGHAHGRARDLGLARGLDHDAHSLYHVYRPFEESSHLGCDEEMGSDRDAVVCDHDDWDDRDQNQSAKMQKEGYEPTASRLAKYWPVVARRNERDKKM